MFNTEATSDMYKSFNQIFLNMPKDSADTMKTLNKIKNVFQKEVKNTTKLWKIYQKIAKGEAEFQEILDANKLAKDLLWSSGIAMSLMTPVTVFMLPSLIEFAKEHNVDIIPDSVYSEFTA